LFIDAINLDKRIILDGKINVWLYCPIYNFALMTSSAVAMIIKWKDIDLSHKKEN
jgi:hypothetical protein